MGRFGDGRRPDEWSLTAASGALTTRLVDATFSNCGVNNELCGAVAPQTYSDETPLGGTAGETFHPVTGADAYFDSSQDDSQDYAIYYFGHGAGNPILSFVAGASTATLTFKRWPTSSGDSGDEYWALDNIAVTAGSVVADKIWVGGAAAGPTNWSQAANWSPTGIPTSTQNVLIPAITNSPALTASASVADLTVSSGAALSIANFTLTVTGNLSNEGFITGSGTVLMSGASKTVSGIVPGLTISGMVSAATSVISTGALTVSSGATFDVNPGPVVVSGNFTQNGLLKMQNPEAAMSVGGNVTINGQSETGLLTAGILSIQGNFTEGSSCCSTNFDTSETFTVVMIGNSAQTISFSYGGVGANAHFQDLQIANTNGGVTFTNAAYVLGNLYILTPTTVGGPGPLTILGDLNTVSGSTFSVTTVTIGGNRTGPGGFTSANALFTGNITLLEPSWPGNLTLSGVTTMGADTTVNGNLSITNLGTMNLNGQSLTVTGNFTTNGFLKMQDAAGVLTVNGTTTNSGQSETGLLTAGLLNVKGNFVEGSSCCNSNFDTSGTFKVAFIGNTAQTISLTYPGAGTSSGFMDLEIANTNGGVSFINAAYIQGNLNITTPTPVSGPGPLTIVGDLNFVSGSTFSVTTVTIGWNRIGAGTFTTPNTTFTRDITLQEPSWPGNMTLTGVATMGVATTINGRLTVTGTMDLNGKNVTVIGDFLSNGLLKMQDPAGVLTVNGDTAINGSSETGILTAGLLNLKGSFTEGSSCCSSNFATSGTFKVALVGSAGQMIQFTYGGGSGNSHFQDMEISNTAGIVTLSSDVFVAGSLIVQPGAVKSLASSTPTLRGLTVTGLDVDGLSLNNVRLVVQPGVISKFDNVAFSNFAGTAIQLSISNPGAATAFTFNNLTFNSTPTTGFYIDATDTATNDGNVFTIKLVNPAPAAQTRFRTNGGAVITWP